MESDGSRTEELKGDDSRRSNVVRFPREWIRPQEELVPFGVDTSSGLESADTPVERPPAADDFWSGEGTWAIQKPLQGPGAEKDAAGSEPAHDGYGAARSSGSLMDRNSHDRQRAWPRGWLRGARGHGRHHGTGDSGTGHWFTRAREMRLAGVRPAQLVAVGAIAVLLLGVLLARLGGSPSAGHLAGQSIIHTERARRGGQQRSPRAAGGQAAATASARCHASGRPSSRCNPPATGHGACADGRLGSGHVCRLRIDRESTSRQPNAACKRILALAQQR